MRLNKCGICEMCLYIGSSLLQEVISNNKVIDNYNLGAMQYFRSRIVVNNHVHPYRKLAYEHYHVNT